MDVAPAGGELPPLLESFRGLTPILPDVPRNFREGSDAAKNTARLLSQRELGKSLYPVLGAAGGKVQLWEKLYFNVGGLHRFDEDSLSGSPLEMRDLSILCKNSLVGSLTNLAGVMTETIIAAVYQIRQERADLSENFRALDHAFSTPDALADSLVEYLETEIFTGLLFVVQLADVAKGLVPSADGVRIGRIVGNSVGLISDIATVGEVPFAELLTRLRKVGDGGYASDAKILYAI